MKPSACLKPRAVAIREEVSSTRPSAPISLAEAYEALAHAYRYKDWNTLAIAFKFPPHAEARQRLGVYLLRADLAQRPSIASIFPRGITLEPLDQDAQVQR